MRHWICPGTFSFAIFLVYLFVLSYCFYWVLFYIILLLIFQFYVFLMSERKYVDWLGGDVEIIQEELEMVNHNQKKYENNLFPTKRKKEKLLFSWIGILFYKFLTLKCLKSKQKKEGLLFVNSTRYKKTWSVIQVSVSLRQLGLLHTLSQRRKK